MSVYLGELGKEKSPYMKLIEWLYDNGHGEIHEEWYRELGRSQPQELPIDEWVKQRYPDIWTQYDTHG